MRNLVTVVSRKCLEKAGSSLASRNFVTEMSFWRNLVTVVSRNTFVAASRMWCGVFCVGCEAGCCC